MSRILIACGGTGGHLAPGIALAEALRGRGHEVQLLISRKQVDARLVSKYPHLKATPIPAAPFSMMPIGFCRFIWGQLSGLLFCLRFSRLVQPDAIVGFGGFGASSVVLAGALLRIPVALHEANRVPGRVVRLFGFLSRRVYLPHGVKISGLPDDRWRFQGLPVRAEFQPLEKAIAREELGLEKAPRVLAVLGGSQGATALNNWVRENLELLAAEGVQVFCIAGPGKTEPESFTFQARTGERIVSKIVPFSDRMATVLSAADLVVSRAGAGTIAELARCATPAVLVPYPHAADNHQAANARAFVESGCGSLVEQESLCLLFQKVCGLLRDRLQLALNEKNLHALNRENALEPMLEDLEKIICSDRPSTRSVHAMFAA